MMYRRYRNREIRGRVVHNYNNNNRNRVKDIIVVIFLCVISYKDDICGVDHKHILLYHHFSFWPMVKLNIDVIIVHVWMIVIACIEDIGIEKLGVGGYNSSIYVNFMDVKYYFVVNYLYMRWYYILKVIRGGSGPLRHPVYRTPFYPTFVATRERV